jgi:predicted  nucleic acid-binding Zn-ribbon protein
MKKETKTTKKKAMTIEDLAIITQRGLAGIESRMATKEELSVIKEKISSINEDVSSIKQRVSSIEEEQKETNRRLTSIERKQTGTTLSLDETVHRSEFDRVVQRVEALEKK